MNKELTEAENTPIKSDSKEDKQKELEQAAKTHSKIGYAKAPLQSHEDAEYIQSVSYHSFIAGANWKSNQQTPTPSTIEQGQQEHPSTVIDEVSEAVIDALKKGADMDIGYLAVGKTVYSRNELISEIRNKTKVGNDTVKNCIALSLEMFTKKHPSNKAEQGQQGDEPKRGCGICGGSLVLIRGRYPKDDKRLVCPTCNTERLEQINEISSKTYGVAMKESSPPPHQSNNQVNSTG